PERHRGAHGARKVGEGDRHTKWRSSDGASATAVPRHGEVGPGLVRAICKATPHTATVSSLTSVTGHPPCRRSRRGSPPERVNVFGSRVRIPSSALDPPGNGVI